MRGKRRLEVDCLTTGNIFICLLVNGYHPSAQPVPLSLKSILTLPYMYKIKVSHLLTCVCARNVTGAANKVLCLGSVCVFLICRKQTLCFCQSFIVAEDFLIFISVY